MSNLAIALVDVDLAQQDYRVGVLLGLVDKSDGGSTYTHAKCLT